MSLSKQINQLTSKASHLINVYKNKIPNEYVDTIKLRTLGLLKIPLLTFLSPTVLESNDSKASVKIALGYRSKNHLNSMYFGALAIGADTAVGLLVIKQLEKTKKKVHFLFKDFNATYLKRVEGDAVFVCEEGKEIQEVIAEAEATGTRTNKSINAYALVPSLFGDEPVAKFKLTLSVKIIK